MLSSFCSLSACAASQSFTWLAFPVAKGKTHQEEGGDGESFPSTDANGDADADANGDDDASKFTQEADASVGWVTGGSLSRDAGDAEGS